MKLRYIFVAAILGLTVCLTAMGQPKKDSHFISGYVSADYTYLSSSVAGKLIALSVLRGHKVSRGQALFKQDPNPELADRDAAQASYLAEKNKLHDLMSGERSSIITGILAERAHAQADINMSKLTLDRHTILYKKNAASKQSVDLAHTTYVANVEKLKEINANLSEAKLGARKNLVSAQRQQIKYAESKLKKISWILEQKSVVSPGEGVVFNTFYQLGEYVPAGRPVLALLTPENIKLVFFVNAAELARIKINQTIRFFVSGDKLRNNAVISYISPQAEYTPPMFYSREQQDKLVYRVEASIPVAKALDFHPGQPVSISYE